MTNGQLSLDLGTPSCPECGRVLVYGKMPKDRIKCTSCKQRSSRWQHMLRKEPGGIAVVLEKRFLKGAGLKRCTDCREVKADDQFSLTSQGFRRGRCIPCRSVQRAAKHQEAKARRIEAGYEVPLEKQCGDCGEVLPIDRFSRDAAHRQPPGRVYPWDTPYP